MKYLAEGFYYKVYDIDNGRVYKKFQPYWFPFLKVYNLCRQKNGWSFFKSILSAHKATIGERKILANMKNKIVKMPVSFFANPIFENKLDYTQDKVISLEDFFIKNNLDDNKKIINGYAELIKNLWAYGIHDKAYKFQNNYGVDAMNKVCFFDFGECYFSKEKAIESIKSKKWLTRNSYKNWKDTGLKKYYTDRMADLMTEENINNNWGLLLK